MYMYLQKNCRCFIEIGNVVEFGELLPDCVHEASGK